MTKRFKLAFEDFDGWAILDTTGEYSDDEDYIDWLSGQKAVDVLNYLSDENEQLKKSVNNLQDTIVTIGRAYQKKHGRTLVDLVDGPLEEDIIDLGTDL